jgi:hypothetical protein
MAVKKNLSIPYTQSRLKPYIAVSMGTYDGTVPFSSAILDNTKMTEVGTVKKFTYTNKRTGSGKYRVFNRQNPGTFFEAFPGLPDYELSLDTTILYRDSLIEVLGYGLEDIGYMDKPLLITLQLLAPGDIPERSWTFRSCWWDGDNKFDFDAQPTDMYIVQTMKIVTAGIVGSGV